jgi:hypothetical protein
MAARFWVGGSGTWDTSNTTNWSATSGGAGGASVPTSADTVTIDASSGTGTIIVNTNFNIISLTCGAMNNMTLDFATNNNSPTIITIFSITGTGIRTINLGNGTFTLSGTGTIFQGTTDINLTLNPGNSTILFSNTSNSLIIIQLGSTYVLNTLTLNRGASTATISFTLGNGMTIRNFNDFGTAAHTLQFQQLRTINIGNFNVRGSAGNLVTIQSNGASPSTLNKSPLGVINTDYITNNPTNPINVTPSTLTWYIGTNSTSPGSGWITTNMPCRDHAQLGA